MKYAALIFLVIIACGCMPTQQVNLTALESNYRNRPILDIENKLGAANNMNIQNDNKLYSWVDNQTRWVDISPAQSIAGTQYINGRNVATIINRPPVRTMQNVSCSFNVLTDINGKIIKLYQTSSGLDCARFYAKL